MNSKEPIMIDGVDILKEKINMCFILLLNKLETPETIEQTIYEHLDAFVKEWNDELVRKTQECEALKSESFTREELITIQEKEIEELKEYIQANKATGICETCTHIALIENDRYYKALKEIEEIVKDWYKNEWSCYKCRINMDKKLKKILDIINKAKGEGND